MPHMTDTKHHVLELQSLRGIMALIVVVSHSSLIYVLQPQARLAIDAVINPHAAVIFFFVLSGYVLQIALSRTKESNHGPQAFYLRRVLRLWPPVLLSSAFAWAVIAFLAIDIPASSEWFADALEPDRLTPIRIVLAFFALSPVLVPPVWTILVEAVGSVYMPIHGWIASRVKDRSIILFLGAVAIAVEIAGTRSQLVAPASYLIYFAAGASLYTHRNQWLDRLIPNRKLNIILIVVAAFMLFGFRSIWFLVKDGRLVPVYTEYFSVWRGLIEGLSACAGVAGVVALKGEIRILSDPRVAKLGDLSFGIYLLHFPLMSLFAWSLFRLFGWDGSSPGITTLLVLSLTLVAVVPLAWVVNRWIELPSIRIGKRAASALAERTAGVKKS